MQEIEITRHGVKLKNLPLAANGTRVIQISDLHRGCGDADELIAETVRQVNELDADYVLVTGDFVDEHKKDVLPAVELVRPLRAKRGVFGVLGNHDQRGDPALLRKSLEAVGIRVLMNENLPLQDGLWVAGVDDILEGKPDFEAALRGIPSDAALIFMTHNPNGFRKVKNGRPMLALSGHTHGGQIAIKFPPPSWVCRIHLHTGYVHGWFHHGNTSLYVNRGIGVTGRRPLAKRVNCPSEITIFTLRSDG